MTVNPINTACLWECTLQENLVVKCNRDSKQSIKMHSASPIVQNCPWEVAIQPETAYYIAIIISGGAMW